MRIVHPSSAPVPGTLSRQISVTKQSQNQRFQECQETKAEN